MKKTQKLSAKKKAAKFKKITLDRDSAPLAPVGQKAAAGDEVSGRQLWEAFHWLAGALAMMADKGQCGVDIGRLFTITQRCQHMLREGVRQKNADCLLTAVSVAGGGCDILREAATEDPAFVASLAERFKTWPVLMAGKKSYHDEANDYLRSIRVGTKSVPRTTASTHVNAIDVRAAELASLILERLSFYRTILGREAVGVQFPRGSTRTAEQSMRIEAREFKEILELQPLASESWKQWWQVGRRILERDWANDPKQAAADIKLIGGKGDSDSRKSARTCAVSKIRSAFRTATKPLFPSPPVLAIG